MLYSTQYVLKWSKNQLNGTGSYQAMIGSSDLIIGKSLGHRSTQSTRVYARIRDNNPIKKSMAGGFAAMVKASKEKKVVNIGGGE